MNYGTISLQIEKVLKENGISKNKICWDLEIPRTNFNRYCRNEFQRIDANLICKLCYYLNVEPKDLIVYKKEPSQTK
jgi:putative transcriptional regulator